MQGICNRGGGAFDPVKGARSRQETSPCRSPVLHRNDHRRKRSMSAVIEDYGIIGDCETVALVGRNGSIDWLCWPRFDSDACFAALLGREERGYWQVRPRGGGVRTSQRYAQDTLLLETDFATSGGAMRVLDFMPLRDRHGTIV